MVCIAFDFFAFRCNRRCLQCTKKYSAEGGYGEKAVNCNIQNPRARSLTHLLDAVAFGYGAEPLSASDGTGWAKAVDSPSLAQGFRLAEAFL